MIPLLFAPGLNNGGIGITAVKGVIHITYQEKHIREFKIRSCFGGGEEAVNRRIEGGGLRTKRPMKLITFISVKITGFYILFYSCLACFFGICLHVALMTIPEDRPKLVGRSNRPSE